MSPPAVPPLVDVPWLASRIDEPDVLPVQVDEDAATYYTGHLPGAGALDWLDDLHEPVRRAFLRQQRFDALMDAKGIGTDTHVVLHGASTSSYAAHAFWIFRYYRHPRLSLLDGGCQAWRVAGHPLTDEVPSRAATDGYRSRGPDVGIRAGRDQVLRSLFESVPDTVLLDCRTREEYEGRSRRLLDLPLDRHRVGGHIPGAVHLPVTAILTESGGLRPVAQLRRLFAERGVTADQNVTVYCRVGERSGLMWFALHELVGHQRSRIYDGGWAEYGSLVDVPVARGATTARTARRSRQGTANLRPGC
jgi:thiosulfate/3-mercaptopyruvate sulfurtransferase